MKPDKLIHIVILLILTNCSVEPDQNRPAPVLLDPGQFRHYVDYFNRMENENIIQAISNDESWDWMTGNIPLFECPQDNFEEIWYYRWWTLRKHIKETPRGYVITEFLVVSF